MIESLNLSYPHILYQWDCFFLTNSSEGLEDTRILKTEERRFNRKVREVLEIQL